MILFGGLIIGLLVYALLVWLLRVGEFMTVIIALRNRFSPKGAAG
jgi:hypothetical protein